MDMSSTDDGAGGGDDHCCKVGRVADGHGLSPGVGDDVNEYLAARWRGDDGYPETSLADLVEWFDRRVMLTVYRSTPSSLWRVSYSAARRLSLASRSFAR